MPAGSECLAVIHLDAKAARRRGVVAPLRNQEKLLPYFHGLQALAGFGDPIDLLRSGHNAAELCCIPRGAGFIFKEDAQAPIVQFHDAGGALLPKFGDDKVFRVLRALDIEREHSELIKLQGIFAALATPFDHKGEIYKAKVQHNVEKWNKVALAGYAVATRIGEGGLLLFEERVELWRLVKETAAPGRILLADVTRESVKESLLLAERAAELGFDAVLCETPFVSDRSPLPVITELPVMLDSAAHLWGALKSGAPGAILGIAGAAPYSCVAIWEAFRSREEDAGLDWQSRIAEPSELLGDVASLKYVMDLNGFYGGLPRAPLPPVSMERKAKLATMFHALNY